MRLLACQNESEVDSVAGRRVQAGPSTAPLHRAVQEETAVLRAERNRETDARFQTHVAPLPPGCAGGDVEKIVKISAA